MKKLFRKRTCKAVVWQAKMTAVLPDALMPWSKHFLQKTFGGLSQLIFETMRTLRYPCLSPASSRC